MALVPQVIVETQPVMMTIITICLIILVWWKYRELYPPMMVETPVVQGFTPGSGAGFWGSRSDGYADITGTVGVSDMTTAILKGQGKAFAKAQQSGMVGHEPPVFWDQGDMAMIAENQAAAAAGMSSTVDGFSNNPTKGLDNRIYTTGYTEGFSGKTLSPY